ncbi:MAG TPA: STAS domain-containing protein [Acidimicrobiales bacterium]|nr:STAS domain-containing protein [Acidimicrobiales bacterium]
MTAGFTEFGPRPRPNPSGARRKPRPWRLAIARAFGSVVVTVHGVLDARTSESLAHALDDLIEGQGNLFVVIDLRDMAVTDPGGLGVLAKARHSLEERKGRLLLAAPSKETEEALRRAGLAEVIEVHVERRYHPSLGRNSASGDEGSLGGTSQAL